MKPLEASPLPNFTEERATVSSWSTIRVLHNTYSVPSRLIAQDVRVRLFEDTLEVWFAERLQLRCPRLLGRQNHHIDYRHIIWSLIRKPGAFARYRFREDLFPTLAFRRAYDRLAAHHAAEIQADLAYLRVLHLAASTMESEVHAALELLLEAGELPTSEAVKTLLRQESGLTPPPLEELTVDLRAYDALLCIGGERP